MATSLFDDLSPSIAVNEDGIFVVGWITFENVNGLTGSDADLAISESVDGFVWSEPRIVNPLFDSDNGDGTKEKKLFSFPEFPFFLLLLDSDFTVSASSRSTSFVSAFACCKAGSSTLNFNRWNSLMNASACPRVQRWSMPMALSSLAASDGTAVDANVVISNDRNGRTLAVWQSNTPNLDFRRQSEPDLMLWWPLTRSFSNPVAGATEIDASGNHRDAILQRVDLIPDRRFPGGDLVSLFTSGDQQIIYRMNGTFPADALTITLWCKLPFPATQNYALFGRRNLVNDGQIEAQFFVGPTTSGYMVAGDTTSFPSSTLPILVCFTRTHFNATRFLNHTQ